MPGCVQDDGFANGFGVAAPNGFAVSPWMSFFITNHYTPMDDGFAI